jgi:hypothetical protein
MRKYKEKQRPASLPVCAIGTLHCTALIIGRQGVVLNKHCRLKPTGAERVEWGENASGNSLRSTTGAMPGSVH